MRVLKKLMAFGAILIGGVALTGCGSTFQVVKGDFAPLAGAQQLNIVYDYQEVSVGDYDREADYIKDTAAEKNDDEAGSGDQWQAEWQSNKASYYQPKFEKLLNSRLSGAGVQASSGLSSAPFTMHVSVLHMEPGWNVGIMRRPAYINVRVRITETADPSREIVELRGEDIPGADAMGFDYAASSRLGEAFAKAGKELGSLLVDEAF